MMRLESAPQDTFGFEEFSDSSKNMILVNPSRIAGVRCRQGAQKTLAIPHESKNNIDCIIRVQCMTVVLKFDCDFKIGIYHTAAIESGKMKTDDGKFVTSSNARYFRSNGVYLFIVSTLTVYICPHFHCRCHERKSWIISVNSSFVSFQM